jgi:hypothetical protein
MWVLSGHSLLDQTLIFKWYMGNLYTIDVLDSIAYLNKILVFERYDGARCGSKNGHQRELGLEEIGLHAQNMITIPS